MSILVFSYLASCQFVKSVSLYRFFGALLFRNWHFFILDSIIVTWKVRLSDVDERYKRLKMGNR